jgi:hypothetical protein
MVCRSVHKFGRRALELRQIGYSQALLALIMSATLVRGALWCENGGSKSTYIDRNLTMHPDDLRALEVFRDGLNDTDRLLANWNASSHPCEWCGVLCMCEEQVNPRGNDELRVKTNLKESYKGRLVDGLKETKRGKFGAVEKNRVETGCILYNRLVQDNQALLHTC